MGIYSGGRRMRHEACGMSWCCSLADDYDDDDNDDGNDNIDDDVKRRHVDDFFLVLANSTFALCAPAVAVS